MPLTIPDELLEKTRLSSQNIKQLVKPKKASKLSHLKNRHCVIGNSDDLVNLDWGDEWKILN